MAFLTGGKHFGQYTYEHWFDHEYGKDNDTTTAEPQTDEINCVPNEGSKPSGFGPTRELK